MFERFIFLFLLIVFADKTICQTTQTKEDIIKIKSLKIKSIRKSVINYSLDNLDSAGKISNIDTNNSFQLFDTTGRLIKEYFGFGIKYLRKFYYNSNDLLDHEIWLCSKLQIYPNLITPRADSDYNALYKKMNYFYDSSNRLIKTVAEKGNTTTYQYNDDGKLIAKIEIEPTGVVNSFTINKYGWERKIKYAVHNYYENTLIMNYEYDQNTKKIIKCETTSEDQKKSITHYNDDEETYEEVFDKNNSLVAKIEYAYNKLGIEKITNYRMPPYFRRKGEPLPKLRVAREEYYYYTTY